AAFPIRAELIVLLALFGIAEDLVGLIDVLEIALGFLVVGIDVAMILARELAIGSFDLRLSRAALDAQDFIVIPELHGGPEPSTCARKSRSAMPPVRNRALSDLTPCPSPFWRGEFGVNVLL